MNGKCDNLIERIQSSGYKACIAIAGGGIGAVHAMLVHPGASRFVLDVQVPYSRDAMNAFLEESPVSYCSEDTARKMAEKALEKGACFAERVVGIACTAALRTFHDRADPDRAYLCICSVERKLCETVELEPDKRQEQDAVVSDALLSLIARFVAE